VLFLSFRGPGGESEDSFNYALSLFGLSNYVTAALQLVAVDSEMVDGGLLPPSSTTFFPTSDFTAPMFTVLIFQRMKIISVTRRDSFSLRLDPPPRALEVEYKGTLSKLPLPFPALCMF